MAWTRYVAVGTLLLAGCSGSSGSSSSSSSTGTSGSGSTSGTTGNVVSPNPTGIAPSSGPTDGGTSVKITGTNFAAGASVKIGANALTGVTVVSPSEIDGTTPAGAVGQVDVIVVNPDSRSGDLRKGFTYTAPSQAPTIGWCNLQFPIDPTGVAGTPLDFFGRVYVQGVTDQLGKGPGVSMQAGLTGDDGGIQWQDATYNTDADGTTPGDHANDEYVLHTAFPAVGTTLAAFRASVGGGDWTYCEKDGPHATLDSTQEDVVTSTPPAVGDISFCNLQFPADAGVAPGDPFTLYGRVYEQGVTDQVGQGAGIDMQAGIGLDDGGFTWSEATYNTDVPSAPGASDINNDEYLYTGVGPAVGTYATAFRARANDGGWHYCELDGMHDAIDPTQLGELISAVPPPPVVSWCNLQFPTAAAGAPGASLSLFGQVYQPGVTDSAGQGPGIAMQAGLGWPDGGWTWNDATYDGDRGNGNANDEYQWTGVDPAVGTYATAFRAMLDGGPWTYCELNGPNSALDVTQAGSLVVSVAAPPTVAWCNLQYPSELQVSPSQPVTAYGRVYQPGVTDQTGQGAGIFMQFGFGFEDGGFTWQDATYNTDVASFSGSSDINNDEYQATFAAGVGNYALAFRAAVDGGPWTDCETDGPHASYAPIAAGSLVVGDTVSWCDLQFPTQAALADAGGNFYGRVYQPGVTDQVGQGAGIEMQFGYGPGDGSWVWTPASYNVDVDGLNAGDHANDEYVTTIATPASGSYFTLYRARLTAGPWLYCEANGPHLGIDLSDAGTMTAP